MIIRRLVKQAAYTLPRFRPSLVYKTEANRYNKVIYLFLLFKEDADLAAVESLSPDVLVLIANVTRYILPILAVFIVVRCIRSMLREHYEPETWAYLYLPGEIMVPIKNWECIIGRARSVDAQVDNPSVNKLHACLVRSPKGKWKVYPLGKSEVMVNRQPAGRTGMAIEDAGVLTLGDISARFVDLTEEERAKLLRYRRMPGRDVHPSFTLFLLTLFQALLALQQLAYNPDINAMIPLAFAVLTGIEWVYFAVMRGAGQRGFEPELLAFFLTSVGLSVCASSTPTAMVKQLALIIVGLLLFIFLGLWMRDLRRMKHLRIPALLLAMGMLGLTLVIGRVTYGAQNWIYIGGFSLQPSEFVKIAYIYAASATLDRLFVNRNLIFFIGYSAVCVGALALMGDFGTALIFFVAFLVISFMRSGSFATLALAIAGAALAVMLILTVKPYIAARFATWGHAWDDVYDSGYQQVRAMSAAASGGLFGQGSGAGWLVDIVAADTDMVFGVVCEELGLITGLCCAAVFPAMAIFVVKNASSGRSSYFVIAASAAITMMMTQLALNVFGAMDILPFTGVTFPFVSMGGSSILACWMMVAFIKGADTRANASFAVVRPDRYSGGAGVEESDPNMPPQRPQDAFSAAGGQHDDYDYPPQPTPPGRHEAPGDIDFVCDNPPQQDSNRSGAYRKGGRR